MIKPRPSANSIFFASVTALLYFSLRGGLSLPETNFRNLLLGLVGSGSMLVAAEIKAILRQDGIRVRNKTMWSGYGIGILSALLLSPLQLAGVIALSQLRHSRH